MPFLEVLNPDRTFKPTEELAQMFKDMGVKDDGKQEVVFTCQRGITSCVLEAAFNEVYGNGKSKVYDGSYEEYARLRGTPESH